MNDQNLTDYADRVKSRLRAAIEANDTATRQKDDAFERGYIRGLRDALHIIDDESITQSMISLGATDAEIRAASSAVDRVIKAMER